MFDIFLGEQGLKQFPNKNSFTVKTTEEKNVQGEPWGKN